jgi:hypothetical protein
MDNERLKKLFEEQEVRQRQLLHDLFEGQNKLMSARFEIVYDRLEGVNNRLDKLNSKVEKHEVKLNGIDKNIATRELTCPVKKDVDDIKMRGFVIAGMKTIVVGFFIFLATVAGAAFSVIKVIEHFKS